ncbi:hypothetical protein CH373_01005 [Leptospira perolatii]|uniref:Antitoxin n=1 Tax=Leptospira perolatii TaxID=2023191 RepID=A0A2M9ZRR8_9LEPT|nr:DUF433 domain-containing protein [Leptospira perolatii]PJZ71129.1 hypothetical protein CH360_01005 [Leptospira perolatii]PJZ74661.1 hypothetical protein CH373_01005 [Leptospira perolatii]
MNEERITSRIVSSPEVCGGKPVIKGTEIRVLEIIDRILLGFGISDILKEYPELSSDDVKACLIYASKKLHSPLLEKALHSTFSEDKAS